MAHIAIRYPLNVPGKFDAGQKLALVSAATFFSTCLSALQKSLTHNDQILMLIPDDQTPSSFSMGFITS